MQRGLLKLITKSFANDPQVEPYIINWVLDRYRETVAAQDDRWLCVNCLKDLGRDMPEGVGCGYCYVFYCEECHHENQRQCTLCEKKIGNEEEEKEGN